MGQEAPNLAQQIEHTMQFMIELNGYVADLQSDLEKTRSDLNMYRTLFDVNNYMSKNIELEILLPVVEDAMRATIGANHAVVFINGMTTVRAIDGVDITFEKLDDLGVTDYLYYSDLKEDPWIGIARGSLYVQKLNLLDDVDGYLLGYWGVSNAVSVSKLDYLKILGVQTELSVRSSLLLEDLKHLAIHDPLTMVYNRAYFNNLEMVSVPSLGDAIVMFDIDNFKRINDSRGHSYGDTILKEFANILKSVVATEAHAVLCFRYGGEEFVMGTTGGEEEATRLGHLVRKRFQEKTGYTVSGGVAAIGQSCRILSYSSMIDLADEALYISKQTGKNKLTTSTADIQMLNQVGEELILALGRGFKNYYDIPFILRLDIKDTTIFKKEQLEEYKSLLANLVRDCDSYHVTNSLSTMFFIETQDYYEEIKGRLQRSLSDKYPFMLYVISSVNTIFKEVLNHSVRMSELSHYVSKAMKIPHKHRQLLALAAEWHDVGKLCIDPVIYSKPGKFTASEFEVIKHHAWLSYTLAKRDVTLKHAADWILMHHENMDGTGYFNFTASEIPIEAQALGLLDKFDALTEDRVYRKAFSWEQALEILSEESAKFDADLFEVFKQTVVTLYDTNKNPTPSNLLNKIQQCHTGGEIETTVLFAT